MALKAQVAALRSVFFAMAAIQLATAASGTFVPLVFSEIGATQEAASLAASAYSSGFLLGCFVVAGSIADFGHIRAFAASAAVACGAAILFAITTNDFALIALRFFVGLSTASIFAIGDAWINETAEGATRGKILSIYAIVVGVVAVASQGMVFLNTSSIGALFLAIALLYCLSIVVISTTHMDPPATGAKINIRLKALLQDSPSAAMGAFATGVVTTTILNVAPFGAAQLGVSTFDIALSIALIYFGRVVFQFPLGALSDRMDRRRVIFVVALVCASVLFVICLLAEPEYSRAGFAYDSLEFALFAAIMVALGGSLLTLYSVLVAHALDRTVPVYISATAVTMLFVWTLGSVAGPLVAGLVTSVLGDSALNWLNFVFMGGFAGFVFWRLRHVPPVEKAEQARGQRVMTTSAELAPETKR